MDTTISALLIDDDKNFNFLQARLLQKSGRFSQIDIALSGRRGIELLEERARGGLPMPDAIFLDINMPGMTGWDFLAELRGRTCLDLSHTRIFILTSSINPDDFRKAEATKEVDELIEKLLTREKVEALTDRYFSGQFRRLSAG